MVAGILWFIIILTVGVYICGPILDPDLWWHITAGRWILANQSVPHVDYWNMFGAGKPWQAYSWSTELLFAFTEKNFGVQGLVVLKLAFAILIALSLAYCFSKISKDWFFGGLLGIYATAACFNHFTLRPQALVWVYFVWLIYQLELISEQGFTRGRRLAVFALMLLWANTHLSTVLGVAAIVLWLWKPHSLNLVFEGVLLGVLGTLFTPYGGTEWVTQFQKSGHPFRHSVIAEFKPATALEYSTVFLLLIYGVLFLFLFAQPKRIRMNGLVCAGVFSLAGLAVVKFLPFAVTVVCALCASTWAAARADPNSLGKLAEGFERLRRLFERVPREGLAFVCLCLTIVNIYALWLHPVNFAHVPQHEFDFIQHNSLPAPILVEFGKGGYAMYRYADKQGQLQPEYRVPIDGRTNVNPFEIWQDYWTALRGLEGWRSYFERVKPRTVLWSNDSALVSLLKEDQQWCRVSRSGQESNGYSIFVDRTVLMERGCSLRSDTCEQLCTDSTAES